MSPRPCLAMKLMASGVAICAGDDEIALVLALLGVDEHDHAPVAHVLEDLGNGGQAAAALREGDGAGIVRHGRNSRSRAT